MNRKIGKLLTLLCLTIPISGYPETNSTRNIIKDKKLPFFLKEYPTANTIADPLPTPTQTAVQNVPREIETSMSNLSGRPWYESLQPGQRLLELDLYQVLRDLNQTAGEPRIQQVYTDWPADSARILSNNEWKAVVYIKSRVRIDRILICYKNTLGATVRVRTNVTQVAPSIYQLRIPETYMNQLFFSHAAELEGKNIGQVREFFAGLYKAATKLRSLNNDAVPTVAPKSLVNSDMSAGDSNQPLSGIGRHQRGSWSYGSADSTGGGGWSAGGDAVVTERQNLAFRQQSEAARLARMQQESPSPAAKADLVQARRNLALQQLNASGAGYDAGTAKIALEDARMALNAAGKNPPQYLVDNFVRAKRAYVLATKEVGYANTKVGVAGKNAGRIAAKITSKQTNSGGPGNYQSGGFLLDAPALLPNADGTVALKAPAEPSRISLAVDKVVGSKAFDYTIRGVGFVAFAYAASEKSIEISAQAKRGNLTSASANFAGYSAMITAMPAVTAVCAPYLQTPPFYAGAILAGGCTAGGLIGVNGLVSSLVEHYGPPLADTIYSTRAGKLASDWSAEQARKLGWIPAAPQVVSLTLTRQASNLH